MLEKLSYFTSKLRKPFGSMSSDALRYFPNPKPDYDENFPLPQVPAVEILSNVKEALMQIEYNVKSIEKNAGDGIYLGTAGIAYMYYHLSKIPTMSAQKAEFLNKAVEYLKPAVNVASCAAIRTKEVPSFILGNCGIYAVAAAIYKAVGDEPQSSQFRELYYGAANICKEPRFLECGSDELFVGRAGYVLGALWMSKETNTPIMKQDIYEICKVIIKSGREYAQRHQSPCPLMFSYYEVEYLGAAHGLCSILQVLMSVPGYLDANALDAVDVKRCMDFLLSIQEKEGNFPAATDQIGRPAGASSPLVHWCHGAAGVVYAAAKAYSVFKEEKYLDSVLLAGDVVWEKGLLRKGPGLCHGVAGNGYVFLLLYRLTRQPKHLYRAIQFYRFTVSDGFRRDARTPDRPHSLYEGLAGTACFFADLTCPLQAAFPFSDVF